MKIEQSVIEHKDFFLKLVFETYLILRRTQRVITNINYVCLHVKFDVQVTVHRNKFL